MTSEIDSYIYIIFFFLSSSSTTSSNSVLEFPIQKHFRIILEIFADITKQIEQETLTTPKTGKRTINVRNK